MIKRISVTGPESTGKSWLAARLSSAYHEPWVPEYAREYLQGLGRPYQFEDILKIASGQLRAEELALAKAREWLFCDTDFLVTRIWCLVKFGKSHPWIDEMIEKRLYTHYFLCNTDLPWEPDPLREHPDHRNELLQMYLNELDDRKLPYSLISGQGDTRFEAAYNVVKQLK